MALPKTLAKAIEKDGRFTDESWHDSDGYWLCLKPGYISGWETHTIHETTVRDCIEQLADIRTCECAECVQLKEAMSDGNEPGASAGDLHRDGGRMAEA